MTKDHFTLVASILVTFVLGSVHAFSLFIVPLENLLQLLRSDYCIGHRFVVGDNGQIQPIRTPGIM